MKNAILAWYAYSESGAASRAARAFARGRLREWAEGLEPEQVGPDADARLAQLDDPDRVL